MAFNQPMIDNLTLEEKAQYELPVKPEELIDEVSRYEEIFDEAWRKGHSDALANVIEYIDGLEPKLDREELIKLIRTEI